MKLHRRIALVAPKTAIFPAIHTAYYSYKDI
jgi:hypothetical protein